jgi:hypothetical protein
MHRTPVGVPVPDGIHQAIIETRSTMHRQACRLVQDRELIILLDQTALDPVDQTGRQARFLPGLQPDRWNTDYITGPELLHRFGAGTVDPHLAGSNDPVDQAPRHTAKQSDQEIVEALTGAILAHGFMSDAFSSGFCHSKRGSRWR